ncbi:maltose permease [Aspergillus bombycis]|uniref:Maltose permease n=1 Tax=Aspergillus bombycis TaxID=109264 RepID=A0A1F7ZLN3_9EURO|nr:maltose permease [Aspergillus bombycis]OGM40354.1 maltose permease [Aspergillus bombycis]
MVQLAALSVAVLASLAPLAAAKNCKTGLNYCGFVLTSIGLLTWFFVSGNYDSQIAVALQAANQPTDDLHFRESLFHCNGGGNGDISFSTYCDGGCQDGGSGNSDHC